MLFNLGGSELLLIVATALFLLLVPCLGVILAKQRKGRDRAAR